MTVSNVSAAQTPGTKQVVIAYDVAADTATVAVSLEVRDGETVLPATSLTGDIGPDVATGAGKQIVWNGGADWNGNVATLTYTVTADDGVAEPPPAGMVLIPGGTNSGTDPDFGAYSLTVSTGGMPYTSPVGSFAANGYGLYDMAGNMGEWCFDWHPSHVGSYRVARGGGWAGGAYCCRVAIRYYHDPGYAYNFFIGFRAVLPPGQ